MLPFLKGSSSMELEKSYSMFRSLTKVEQFKLKLYQASHYSSKKQNPKTPKPKPTQTNNPQAVKPSSQQ